MTSPGCSIRACALPWFSRKVPRWRRPIALIGASVATLSASGGALPTGGAELAAAAAALVLLAVLVGRSLAAPFAVVALALAVGMATATALGFAGGSPEAGALAAVLSVANGVQLTATIVQQSRLGLPKDMAIARALVGQLKPLSLTAAIALIGGFGLTLASGPGQQALGHAVAVGAGVGWFYTVLVFPALVAVLPARLGRADGTLLARQR